VVGEDTDILARMGKEFSINPMATTDSISAINTRDFWQHELQFPDIRIVTVTEFLQTLQEANEWQP
jgi:hypothetical protein